MESGINDINQKKGGAEMTLPFFINRRQLPGSKVQRSGFIDCGLRISECGWPQRDMLTQSSDLSTQSLSFPPYHNVAFLYPTP